MKIQNICFVLLVSCCAILSAVGQDVNTADSTEIPSSGAEATAEDSQLDFDEAADSVKPDSKVSEKAEEAEPPVQTGPFIDLFGSTLLSLEMVDDSHAQITQHYTNDALRGKKVIGLYFSADWCGPCRQFTPDLVSFYNKMNARRGKEDNFEIIWVSRCRDVESFGQYFTHMNWLAMPPEEAMGQRGQMLSDKYKVKGIPSLTLLDEVGNVITTDARNKIPTDKAGVGFPWRNPFLTVYMTVVPKTLRLMVKTQIESVKNKANAKISALLGKKAMA